MKLNKKGFTLIELMIVVAIIGILAAVAVPKFADLINKSKEGATKGALSAVRGALQVYYSDNEGWYPSTDLSPLTTNGKYINEIPAAKIPTRHADSATVVTTPADGGGWYYVNGITATNWGDFKVNCSHTDIKGTTVWSTF
ncbi:MAG: general secretion pathway protein GspG [Elusimicrobia bacterium CG08_land_8_20_14_0_20_51_18]|nr:MAG: general secretion pathway protein GspG [Elusimicrobia bacterium CG08_land_8_20_14_0_20_51_18]